MTALVWVLVSAADAGPAQSGVLYPGARPIMDDRGTAWAGVGGMVGVQFGPDDGRAIYGGALDTGVVLRTGGPDLTLFGHLHGWRLGEDEGALAALALGVSLLDRPGVRLTGLVGGAYDHRGRLHGVPGLAVLIGPDSGIQFDATLMPWTVSRPITRIRRWGLREPDRRAPLGDSGWSHGTAFPFGSAGVSFAFPERVPHLRGRIRLGYPDLYTLQIDGHKRYVDVGLTIPGGILWYVRFGTYLGRPRMGCPESGENRTVPEFHRIPRAATRLRGARGARCRSNP